MSTLYVYETAHAAEAVGRARLGTRGALELSSEHLAFDDFVAQIAGEGSGPRLSRVAESLAFDSLCAQIGPPLDGARESASLTRVLACVCEAFSAAAIEAPRASAAARRLDSGVRAHAEALIAAYGRYRRAIDRQQLQDRGAIIARAVGRLSSGARIALLDEIKSVEFRGLDRWDERRMSVVRALAQRWIEVRVEVPFVETSAWLARATQTTRIAFERQHELSTLELVPSHLPPPSALEALLHDTPIAEAREIAARVRALLDAGTTCDSIRVVAESRTRRSEIIAALGARGVPVTRASHLSVADTACVRAVLSVYSLLDERMPREAFVAWLSSRYLRGGGLDADYLAPHRVGLALRAAGIARVDDDSTQGRTDRYLASLPEKRRESMSRAFSHANDYARRLARLPARGTLLAHVRALEALLDDLEIAARARAHRLGTSGVDDEDDDVLIAIERDQAALRELFGTLAELPRAAAQLGMARQDYTRARFAKLLEGLLHARRPRATDVRGAIVEVSSLKSARPAPHLFVCGLVEAELPQVSRDEPLLDDELRRKLNATLGAPLFESTAYGDEYALLALARLCSASGAVTLSRTRANGEGVEQLRSSAYDALSSLWQPITETYVRTDVLDSLASVETDRELVQLLATQPSLDLEATRALLSARGRDALALVQETLRIERARAAFFASPAHSGDEHVGVLAAAETLALVAARIPGTADRPLSASAVEDYAACGFKFFAKRILRATSSEEVDEELDPAAEGTLWHDALTTLYRKLSSRGLLPLLAATDVAPFISETCAEVVARWRSQRPIGHDALFDIEARRLAHKLAQVMGAEREGELFGGLVPCYFEQPFEAVELPVTSSTHPAVWIRGSIDRIDVLGDRAMVIEYKRGSPEHFRAHGKPEANRKTAWQLPIYAAVARQLVSARSVAARYVLLRGMTATKTLEDPDLAIGDDLAALRARMTGGEFAVRPSEKACARCDLGALCRVRESDPEPGDDA